MGHRANYVIIEDGQPAIYFSRWGALTIPAVLLSGPDATTAYVRALTPDDALLDDTWAEGGLALHLGQRELRFFGGLVIESSPYLRRPLLRALRMLWQGWSVEWAAHGIADLALFLGWDVDRVLTSESSDSLLLGSSNPIVNEGQVQTTQVLRQAYSIVTVRWSQSDVRDYWLSPQAVFALSLGPRLLELLANATDSTLPREDDPDLPGNGAYFDVPSRAMWMWELWAFDPRLVAAMERRWPGWHAHGHVDGLVRQVELSGRDAAPIKVPEDRAIEELVEELSRESAIDPTSLFAALTRSAQDSQPGGGQITVGKGFFSADGPPLSPEERREVLLSLLRATTNGADSAS
jgi:hypothetical protein